MTMKPDTSTAVAGYNECVLTDPVFSALEKERQAYKAYAESLAGLARIGAFSNDIPTDDLLERQLEQLAAFEAAEAEASLALVEAEQELLTTRPTSIKGAAALLYFLRRHLNEDPDITPVLETLGNIEAFLNDSEQSVVVSYDREYL